MRSMQASVARIWAITGLMAVLVAGYGILLGAGLAEPPEKKSDPTQGANETPDAKGDGIVWKAKADLDTPGWLAGSVAYSSDGKLLVIGGSGGQVYAFDAATLKKKWTAEVGGNFAAVAFTADGKSVLATIRAGVRFIDTATGKLGNAIEDAKAPPDWHVLAVGAFPDRIIESGDQKLIDHKIIFGSPLGYVIKEWIESAAPGTIAVSTVAKGKKPADATAVPLAVDPNGTSAIILGPIHRDTGKNVLWAYVAGNYEKGSPGNRLLDGHEAAVVSAAWSKDGKTAVTGDASGRVLVWNAKTMKETHRLELGQRIAALAVTADGKHIAAAVVGKQAAFYVWATAQSANKMKPIHVDTSDFDGAIHASLAFLTRYGQRLAGDSAYNEVWLTRLGELIGKVHVWDAPKVPAEPKPPKNAK